MLKITHTGEDIDWVNGPDKPGADNTYLNASECGDVLDNQSWYRVVSGNVELRPDWEAIRDAELQANADKAARVAEIVAEQEAEGTSKYSPAQAKTFLNNKTDLTAFDAATTVTQIKAALRVLFVNNKDVLRKLIIEALK